MTKNGLGPSRLKPNKHLFHSGFYMVCAKLEIFFGIYCKCCPILEEQKSKEAPKRISMLGDITTF